jgi:hypothetical protein
VKRAAIAWVSWRFQLSVNPARVDPMAAREDRTGTVVVIQLLSFRGGTEIPLHLLTRQNQDKRISRDAQELLVRANK